MNLYIWNHVYPVSYGGTVAYVVAESEDRARELLKNAPISEYGYEPRRSAALAIDRKPDRVLPAPCAEIYHWEE